MPAVQQWGRKESIVWPPRGYLYTLGALCLSPIASCVSAARLTTRSPESPWF